MEPAWLDWARKHNAHAQSGLSFAGSPYDIERYTAIRAIAAENESGFETRATKLLALLDRNRHGHPPHINHIYKVFLRCEILGGSPTTSHEIQGVGFFGEDILPDLSLTRNVPAQIARMFEHYRNPDLPADFD
jgi:hypothetical protein